MFSDDMESSSGISLTVVIFSLLLFSVAAVFLSRQNRPHDSVTKLFTWLMAIIVIISFTYSISYPFGSRFMYGFLLLPLCLYYFTGTAIPFARDDSCLVWAMTAVSLMLTFYYFNNYYGNINYEIESANSASYAILYLLPFLLCHKNRVLHGLFIALSIIVVMFSLKRGGFIALLFAVLVYLIVVMLLSKKNKSAFIWKLLFLLAGTVGIYFLVQFINTEVLEGSLFNRMNQIEEKGGSGRLDIYAYYLSFIGNDSIGHWLFGHGFQGSIRDTTIGYTCHNDFLEAFVDYGIFGLAFFIALNVSLIKHLIQMIKEKHPYAPAMGVSVALFFANSMVSHILIYPRYMVIFALFWGFIAASTRELTE